MSFFTSFFTHGRIATVGLLFLLFLTPAGAQTLWLANPADGDWNNAANWNPATVPNGSTVEVEFDQTSTPGVSLSAPTDVGRITFEAAANPYTLQLNGNLLRVFGDGIINNSSETQTFLVNGTSAFFNNAHAGDDTVAYNLQGSGSYLQFQGTSSAGDAVYTVGADTYLQFMADSSSGDSRMIMNGGYLVLQKNSTPLSIGSLEGNGTVGFFNVEASSQTLQAGSLNTNTLYSGIIVDWDANVSGILEKTGTGTLTLTGAATQKGGTIISDGTLQIGNGGSTGSLAGDVLNNSALIFNRSNDLNFGGDISGTGTLTQAGGGVLTLTGDNSYSGGTNLAAGTLSLGSNTAAGTGAIFTTGSVIDYADGVTLANPIILNSNDTQLQVTTGSATQFGIISETGGARPLEKIGAGALTLSGANTYSGGTTLSEGTLVVTNVDSLGSGLLTLADGTTLSRTTDSLTLNNNLAINGDVTFSRIGGGISALDLNGAVSLAPGTHTLTVANQGNPRFFGVISGDAGLTIGGGNVTFAGTSANTYTGLTTVLSGGTLGLSKNANLAAVPGDVVIDDGGTVNVSQKNQFGPTSTVTVNGQLDARGSAFSFSIPTLLGAGTINYNTVPPAPGTLTVGSGAFSGIIQNTFGPLSLTKTSADTLILSGNNTYSGGTTISAGTLQIGDGGTTGSIVGDVANNGTFIFNRSGDVTYSGTVSGSGGVVNDGYIIRLTETQTYTGPTILNSGFFVLPLNLDQALAASTTVHIESGATLDVSNAELAISGLTGAGEVYSFGGNAGHLTVDVANGDSQLFSGTMGGLYPNFAFTKSGDGTLSLTGTSTYTGETTVDAGELIVNGTLGATDVTVNSGALLGGDGTIAGAITIADGGTLAAGNSPGTLTVGDLTLNNTSVLDYELGIPGPSDFIQVNGDLTLDGILNLTALSGFGDGTYGLFGYTGSLTDNELLFGNVPGLYDLTVDTNTSNEVNLLVEAATTQYWDGSNTTPNGTINGGTGTWDGSTTNWTNTGGNANAAWGGGLGATFAGTPGNVYIANGFTADAGGYEFQVGGYIVWGLGNGEIALSGNTPFITADGTTTIQVPISGTGLLEKEGTGSLTLTGSNTYTGGTTLSEGTLIIGNNSALGTGDLTIADGTTLATDGNPRRITNNMVVNGDFSVFPDGTFLNFSAFELDGNMDLGGGDRTITNPMNFNASEFGQVNFGGVISNGGLTFASDLSLPQPNAVFFRLDGTESNTYTGDTVVGEAVSLTLDKSGGATAIAGDVNIENEAVLVINQSEQIADSSEVNLAGNGRLQVGIGSDVTETIGSLTDDGSGDAEVVLSDNTTGSQLIVDSGDFSGTITEGLAGGASLVKSGPGTLILRGASDYLGDTVLDGGILRLENNDAISSGTLRVLGSTISYADGVVITNPVDLQNDVDLEVLGGDAARQHGPIGETGGSYGITKVGEGVLRLTGSNTYTGETIVKDGVLVVRGNGSVNTSSEVVVGDGFFDEGTLRVRGSDASLATTDELLVGNWGEGTLQVRNGGTVVADSITVAERLTSDGLVRVSGTDSTLVSLSDFTVGRRGDGFMRVDDGGVVLAEDLYIARGLFSDSAVRIQDEGSTLFLSGNLQVGNILNEGFLSIEDGAVALVDGDASFGRLWTGNGFADVVGWESILSIGGELQVGGWGEGSLHILDGASTVVGADAIIGESLTGEGDVLVAGSDPVSGDNSILIVSDSLQVGQSGEGQLGILDGGRVVVGTFAGAGLADTGMGTITVRDNGSLLTTSDNLIIGGSGDGSLDVLNQGIVAVGGDLLVAGSGPAYGEVRVRDAGSIIQVGGSLSLGSPEGSEMRIQNGGIVSASMATVGTSVGDGGLLNLNGPGSVLEIRESPLTVGFFGEGVLNLRNGALLDHSAVFDPVESEFMPVQLAWTPDSRGTLRIGNNSGTAAPGILDASGVFGGDGDARLIFGHNAPTYFFTNDGLFDGNPVVISGSTRVVQREGGTVLNANNTHTGGTRILGGKLYADHAHALGNGPVQIDGGALHALTSLSIGGDLDWTDGTIFQTLGTTTTQLHVDGTLTLGAPGEFDFTAGTGFSNQTPYKIISTNGALPFDPGTDFIGNPLFGLTPVFSILGDDLFVNYADSFIAGGALLQNSNPVNVPTFADFIVSGEVQTGDASENNTVRSLSFDPGSSLRVFNLLEVSSGIFRVETGSAEVYGDRIAFPVGFEKTGGGTLTYGANFGTHWGDVLISDGSLILTGTMNADRITMDGERFEVQGMIGGGEAHLNQGITILGSNPGVLVTTDLFISDNAQLEILKEGRLVSSGAANINGGRMIVNGNADVTNGLFVHRGGLLGGTGTVNGNLLTSGTVSPGNSIGTLTVDGDYTQTSDGILLNEIASPGHADLLMITGMANLDGRLQLRVNTGGVDYGDSVLVLIARGGIQGQFNEIAGAPNGFRARRWMSGNGTRFNVLFAPSSYTLVAEGDNQLALASALDQWIGSTDPELFAATFQLDRLRTSQYPVVFETILPTFYASLSAEVLAGATHDGRTVNGESVFAQRVPRPETEEDRNHWRLWTDLRGGYAENDLFNMDSQGGTLLLGMDTLLGEALVAGLYVGGQERDSKDSDPSYETEGIRFGVYSSLSVAENGYLSAVLGGGVSENDTQRPLPFDQSTDASFDGSDWFARLETGYRFESSVVFTPFIGVQHSSSTFDGFQEDSASVFALGVDEHDTERTEGFAGLRLSKPIPLNDGTSQLSPYASVLYRGAFSDDEATLNSRLRRGEGPSFATQTPATDVDGFEYGAGIRWNHLENGLGLHLGYTGFTGEDRDSHLINLGISIGR